MIELPKDAEGREIPLDTVAIYDDSGNVHSIRRFIYTNDFDLYDKWINSWVMVVDDYKTAKPEQMHLTQPDSWEKLEDDLSRTAGASDAMCAYFGDDNRDCVACRLNKESFKAIPYCNPCLAFKDILDRIRKLRGEDE